MTVVAVAGAVVVALLYLHSRASERHGIQRAFRRLAKDKTLEITADVSEVLTGK